MRTNNENYEPFFVLLPDYNYFVVFVKKTCIDFYLPW